MKTTPFTKMHQQLGAKMAEFAGYLMPISYTGINEEHNAVRKNAGVFDVSHMGEFILKGDKALDLIQRVTSNDASKLTSGKAQYSVLPNENGGIVDDLLVYCIEENMVYMLVVNASNIEKDWNWISRFNSDNVEMHNISENMPAGSAGPECHQDTAVVDRNGSPEHEVLHFFKRDVCRREKRFGKRYRIYRGRRGRDLF
jgi:aminomethyltransferase